MAVSCPRCGNQVEQDFGVATCLHCQAVLFVNMDGNAQVTEGSGDQGSSIPESASENALEGALELDPYSESNLRIDPSFESGIDPEIEPNLELDPISEPAHTTTASETGTGIFESTEQVLGAISYSLKIENIDTKDIRLLVIKALDDVKFQWDSHEIMRSVKDGAIELINLNPVKASVVVQRVRDLPVKISWKQNVYN